MKPLTSQRVRYVISDLIGSEAAFLLFNVYRFFLLENDRSVYVSLGNFLLGPKLLTEQILLPLFMMCVYWLSGYYNAPFQRSRLQEFFNTLFCAAFNTLFIMLALLTNDMTTLLRQNFELLLLLFDLLFLFTYLPRLCITMRSIRKMELEELIFPTLVIGNSEKAHAFIQTLSANRRKGIFTVKAFIDIPGEAPHSSQYPSYPLAELENVIARMKIERVLLAPQEFNDREMMELLQRLFPLGVDVRIAPGKFNFLTSTIRLNDIFGEPLVTLTAPNTGEASKNIKRFIDIIISASAILLLSPLYLILYCAVKMDSRGPAFYSQTRIGYRQKPFRIYKFRTMCTDAEASGPQLSRSRDSRITRVGAVLRKYRLDEIPQFWNVLRGDMSIVGPRPERLFYIEQIVREAPYYTLLHQVRPGITSWGMVKYGYASSLDEMVERANYDLIYLQNMSLSVDFKIMIYTLKTVLSGKGV